VWHAKDAKMFSRPHAVLSLAGDVWAIADGDGRRVASHNGTFVNGDRVPLSGRQLRTGDRIRVCDLRMVFDADHESTFAPESAVGLADSDSYLTVQPADRLLVLLEISTLLRSTLDPAVILDHVLEQTFRLFPPAERGFVVMRETRPDALVVRAIRTPNGSPVDERFSTTVIRRCLDRGEGVLGTDLPGEFPESASVGAIPARSLLCVPLWSATGEPVGAIQIDSQSESRKFTTDDLRLLMGVAGQASVALSNARAHRESLAAQRKARDLEVAQQVQLALLPGSVPDVPGYTFHAHYAAADEVGGDYYEFVPLPGRRLAVLLGDVAGHGVPAGLLMARLGAQALACLESEPDLPAAVSRLNDLVCRTGVSGRFVTLAAVILDTAAHTVTVVNAGHPPPLVRRADGTVEDAITQDASGPPLGFSAGLRYESHHLTLRAGESVVLFSDGVTDAVDSDDALFGSDRVRAVVAGNGPCPTAIGRAVSTTLARHVAGGPQTDDITLVCFGRAIG
jgi:serine phosphatase RsbU (regulator of sigma subunit)